MKNKKILVVDDEAPLRNALSIKLSNKGIEVFPAKNGQEAIDILEKEDFMLDLVLLDLVMPQGDGFSVLEYIKNKKKTVPVFVTTNLGQSGDEERSMNLGAIKYFVKSDTQISDIVKAVEEYLK